jgi:hypothetical protein
MYMTETEGFLDMVARKCAKFMRAGGGALPKEQNPISSRTSVAVSR